MNTQEESQIAYENILVDNDKHAVYVDGKLCELTYKEFELFKIPCHQQGNRAVAGIRS